MRRSLIVTVAASTAMVLLAMLIPMSLLIEDYAMEDRLARAALEVQATETVVSGRDKGTVAVYLDSVNTDGRSILTTVLYPDGTSIGPVPGEGSRVRQARETGRARVDDIPGGAEMLVPVSLGGGSALPETTPVVRVTVLDRGIGGSVRTTWIVLGLLGLVLLGASLLVADRLGQQFVRPMKALATSAGRLGDQDLRAPVEVEGPPEVREVAHALNRLVDRVDELLERERESVADLSHRLRTPITALRLDAESLPASPARDRLTADVDALTRTVDAVVREARRSQREGLDAFTDASAVVARRAEFWRPLAEEQDRDFEVAVPAQAHPVATSQVDLEAVVDVLLDNVFSHTADGSGLTVTLGPRTGGGAVLVVADEGDGLPEGVDPAARGTSSAGSTGLGLSIAARTAEASGGELRLERSGSGGARVVVSLGPPRWVAGSDPATEASVSG